MYAIRSYYDARLDTNILAGGVPVSTLNRDEDNIVYNSDQYVQGKLAILDNVDIHAGLRHRITSYNVCYTKLLRLHPPSPD